MLRTDKVIWNNCYFLFQFTANDGTLFTFQTNLNAPRYRLIKIDIAKNVLEWSVCINKDVLVLCYLHDVKVYEKQIAGHEYVFLCYRKTLLFDFLHSFMVCYELIWYMGRLVTNQQRSHFSLSSLHSCLSFGFVFMSMRSSEFWNFRTLT